MLYQNVIYIKTQRIQYFFPFIVKYKYYLKHNRHKVFRKIQFNKVYKEISFTPPQLILVVCHSALCPILILFLNRKYVSKQDTEKSVIVAMTDLWLPFISVCGQQVATTCTGFLAQVVLVRVLDTNYDILQWSWVKNLIRVVIRQKTLVKRPSACKILCYSFDFKHFAIALSNDWWLISTYHDTTV